MADDSRSEERALYRDYRKTLIDLETKAQESFEKAMLTLSGGALGLSISFLHDIAPHPQFLHLAIISWSCFCLTLACTISAFLCSQHSLRSARNEWDESYRKRKSSQGNSVGEVVQPSLVIGQKGASLQVSPNSQYKALEIKIENTQTVSSIFASLENLPIASPSTSVALAQTGQSTTDSTEGQKQNPQPRKKSEFWTKLYFGLTWLSFLLFSSGVFVFAMFAYSNLEVEAKAWEIEQTAAKNLAKEANAKNEQSKTADTSP